MSTIAPTATAATAGADATAATHAAAKAKTAYPACTLAQLNAPYTPTWNRLHMNGGDVALPALAVPDPGAIEITVPASFKPADSMRFERAYGQRAAESLAHGKPIECGLGQSALAQLTSMARSNASLWAFEIGEGTHEDRPCVLRLHACQGAAAAAGLMLTVGKDAHVKLVLEADSASAGSPNAAGADSMAGLVGTTVRIFAKEGAHVDISQLQTLDMGWTYIEEIDLILEEGAKVTMSQQFLGAQTSYYGLGAALYGKDASLDIATSYLGTSTMLKDFNYLIRHYGPTTNSTWKASGVLTGSANKTLRGTIDLVKGSKGANGLELENVLLANKKVRNATLPIILCTEDDVQGNHGATIGHIPAEQHEYLASRGLDDDQIEALFLRSLFDYAGTLAHDDASRESIQRLENALIGGAE